MPHPADAPGPAPARRPLRVAVVGAECTGKTTLAAALAAHYDARWLPEFVRGFVERKCGAVEAADVPRIARGHLGAEAAALTNAPSVLFLDTDLVSTCVYSRYYYGACPAWVETASYARHADLYLLAEADIPWQPDPGQRDGPEVRAAVQVLLRAELSARRLPHVVLSGPLDARLRTATRAVDARLGGGAPPSPPAATPSR